MSLRTVVEVALHFESFRNVDLFHQGLYHLKSRLYREESNHRVFATPYSHFTCPLAVEAPAKAKPSRTDHHHLIPAHIIEDQCSFSTRSFLIRYCEEEVEIDDVGQFRVELSAEEAEAPIVVLEVDLMFADLTQHGGADRFGDSPDVDSTEFKSVSSQRFRLRKVDQGLHEFCPVVFDEFHFCLANIVVHSVVLDYRLRLHPLDPVVVRPAVLQAGEAGAAGAQQAAGGSGSSRGSRPPKVGGAAPASAGTGAPAKPELPALSLGERLFGAGEQTAEGMLETAEGLYERHIGALAASYARQAEWFQMVCGKCLTEAQREALGDFIEAKELRLPDGVPAHPSSSSSARPEHAAGALRASLAARLGSDKSERSLTAVLAYDLNVVSCQVVELWHRVLNVMSYACREVAALLRMGWEEQIVDQWSISVLRDALGSDLSRPDDINIGEAHDKASEKLRRTAKARPPENIEDIGMFPSLDQRPILFEQRYGPKSSAGGNGYSQLPTESRGLVPSAPKEYRGVHLFVLVHGFQGNSFDMRLMKNNLALLYPDAIFLSSNSNEDNTEGDFNEMGIRLAQEVVNYICDWCPGSALGRLSFIAHSIGGLIVRSALPLLHEYSSKMFTILTFSTPHVGYFLKNISLFHMGLRVLQSWRQSMCLSQLSMSDAEEPRETFLYGLSATKGFEYFQNVVLVSCPSDQYSPFDSARVEIGGMLDKHSHKDVYIEMVQNLWERVKPERVFRFDVNFHIPEKNLDTFIGRASHIQFLECQPLMRMIIHNYSFLFR